MSAADHVISWGERWKRASFAALFVNTRDPEWLDRAIEAGLSAHQRSVRAGHGMTAARSALDVARLLRDRSYLRAGAEAVEDLDLAETLLTSSLDALAEAPPYRNVALVDLGAVRARRYELTLDPGDLDAAEEAYVVALVDPVLMPVNRSICLVSMADLKHELFERRGRTEDLDGAVRAATEALALEETTPEHRFETRAVLADALVDRAEAVAADAHLDPQGTEHAERAVKDHLDKAVTLFEELLTLPPERDINRELPRLRGNLAYALRTRHLLTGDPEDLDRQIELLETTLAEVTAPGAADPPDAATALKWMIERDRPAEGGTA
ncbi:hypothetical protein [Streptomyces sp. NPDC048606]|uniref:hypothetical protein n=1 Tax=Streptomyces sp. NPDC048606 TaxID=3154726 RepID=UPI0034249624